MNLLTNHLFSKNHTSTSFANTINGRRSYHFQFQKNFVTSSKIELLSNVEFWKKVKEIPTLVKEGPVYFQGHKIFPSLADGKRSIFLSCSKQSEYVQKFFIQSSLKGMILDLGCGMGVNSIPLWKKGCKVTAIDNLPEMIKIYSDNVKKCKEFSSNESPSIIFDDIVTCEYPKNVDAVIGVDVLQYILPVNLEETLKKIFNATASGGKFIGTLFFKSDSENDPLIEGMEIMGCHFYPGKEFTTEMITRVGFKLNFIRIRNDNLPIPDFCLEFLAEKPV